MLWPFVVFLTMLGLCLGARAETLPPGPFTTQFAQSLQAAVTASTVTVVRDLQITVRRADRTSATVNLDNAYRDYSGDPKRFDSLIKIFAKALAGAPQKEAKLDRTRIVPVIKDRLWLAELQDIFKKQDAAQQPVFDDFNKELVVVYAEDSASRTRYLGSKEELGVARG